MAKLGETIRTARKARGLTLRALAEETGLHYAYLSQLETGKTPGGHKAIVAVADALGLERDDLLTIGGRPPEGLASAISRDPTLFQQISQLGQQGISRCLHPFRLLGRVPAGPLAEAVADAEDFRLADVFAPEDCFLLRITGDSMIEAHICDGDLVVVSPQETIENGEIAVVLVREEDATVKRVYRRRQVVELRPANANMQPIRVQPADLRILGRVVGVIRPTL